MLYFTIIYWVLTLLFSLSYVLLVFSYLGSATARDNNLRGYLLVASCFLASILFTSLKEVVSVDVAFLIWKILSVIPLFLITGICLFSSQRIVYNIIPLIGCLLFGIIPFIINIEILPSDGILPQLENIYSLDLIIICSIIIVFLFSLILIKHSSKKTLINSINELRNEIAFINVTKEKQRDAFMEPYERSLTEELHSQMIKLRSAIKDTTYEFRSIINEAPVSSNKKGMDSEVVTNLLYELINSIEHLKKKVSIISPNDQKEPSHNDLDTLDIIKELNHFLATPFSSIKANCELIRIQEGNKKQIQYIDRIVNCIRLCECVVAAYREITNVSHSFSDPSFSIEKGLNSAFELYVLENEKTNIKLEMSLPNSISGHSNNFIISTISPLLQNAVCASPDNGKIELVYRENSDSYSIEISNFCINVPTVEQLNTVGYSSKPDHAGTGLLIVRHLLQLRKRGVLNLDIQGNKVIFKVNLKKEL